MEYSNYDELEAAFARSELHPVDLKVAVAVRLNQLLDPVRKIFEQPEMKKLTAAAYPPPAKATKAVDDVIAPHRLDIRIGKIVEVERHPDADGFYVKKIDLGKFSSGVLFDFCQIYQKYVCCWLGEETPRTVVSGLVKFVSESAMLNRLVVVLCNLKPVKMQGIESSAMVLCASM